MVSAKHVESYAFMEKTPRLIRWEIPRLCRGGSSSLTVPEAWFPSIVVRVRECDWPLHEKCLGAKGNFGRGCFWVDCDEAPLTGPQSKSLRLCRRMLTFQPSDERMCLLYGATARVVNRHGGFQSTNSFSLALCSEAQHHNLFAPPALIPLAKTPER